jgi:hypothetical protein
MMDESAKENFLAQWPQNKRATIMNQILASIRDGHASTPTQMIEWLRSDIIRRVSKPYADSDAKNAQFTLMRVIAEPSMTPMCEYCLWWESLPYDEKQQIKRTRGTDYAKQAMAGQPPTEKQLKYLKALGCDDIPASKAQASEWIDARVNR